MAGFSKGAKEQGRDFYENVVKPSMVETENCPPFLPIAEKREWLARIFRDTTGNYSDADKYKAMMEDTRLASLNYTLKRKEELND